MEYPDNVTFFVRGQLASGNGPPNRLIGTDGDFYIDAQNSLLYGPKWGVWSRHPFSFKGVRGLEGEAGINGSDGDRGSRVTISSDAPGPSDGSVGDYHFKLNDEGEIELFYGPKTISGWLDGFSFAANDTDNSAFKIGIMNDAKIMNSVIPSQDVQADIGRIDRRYQNIYLMKLFTDMYPIITSDARFKKNIADIDLGTEFIKSIRPVEYRYINDPDKIHYGVIAQELEDVLKKSSSDTNIALCENKDDHLGVRYSELIAPLIKATQELFAEYEEQRNLIKELKTRIEHIENK